MDASKEPASGPQRDGSSSSAATIAPKQEREKRKRSRVTPEQLVHLERFFAMDRSPTAARRKEISDMLGMPERQTQIWFQNRRAKAKLQDGKKGRGDSAESPPDTPPELTTGYEAELHNMLHEDEPVTIIPCTDLSIGTWRRIATTVGKHDLVAYLCDTKRCLTWFIHSAGDGFKMEIPFDIVADTEFTNAAPGSGMASFFLARPPTFYVETLSPPVPAQGTEPVRHWKQCADWTEGQQATKVLRHDLVGSAVQLAHVLRHLNTHTTSPDIRLHAPSYFNQDTSPAPAEMPQSIMAFDISPASFSNSHQGHCGPTYPSYPSGLPIQTNNPPIFSDYRGSAVAHVSSYLSDGRPPSGSIAHTPLASPSPPLLTTPFYPAGPSSIVPNARASRPPLSLASGMPGVVFNADDVPQRRNP
ncbi:hypothetical protein F5J12DRAFT_715686 [Pisolithus orientalis]|uniref:uncharacterized protein n=1 Tax=Pisolithus orientalis TaxID=936130 RepID=UPI00222560D5|nr:uncharacterized protein F5J12DRAFT_715686 [Pisolithus orientalis]KAI6025786.1 hypothetical protein F5J12DRAFT_715686 [Pisolithus orientalis]